MGLTPEQYSIIGLLLAALGTLITEQWYPKGTFNKMVAQYEERLKQADSRLASMTEDRDEYRKLVLELLPINRDALKLAEQSAKRR